MRTVTIYSKDYCPYCTRAKNLLKQKGVSDFIEIDISNNETLQQEMITKTGGRRSVPQIFVGDTYIGDCDGIYALEKAGKLSDLLVK